MAAVRSVAFSADGRQIISSSDDKTIKIWAVNKSKYKKINKICISLTARIYMLIDLLLLSLTTQIGFVVFDLLLMELKWFLVQVLFFVCSQFNLANIVLMLLFLHYR